MSLSENRQLRKVNSIYTKGQTCLYKAVCLFEASY